MLLLYIMAVNSVLIIGYCDETAFKKMLYMPDKLLTPYNESVEIDCLGECEQYLTDQCAMQCIHHPTCKSFAVLPSIRMCYLYENRVYSGMTTILISDGDQIKYFWQLQGNCPISDGYIENPSSKICYKYHSTKLSWFEAEARCEEEGGHLFMLDTQEKLDFLAQFTTPGRRFFVGATDQVEEGVWKWFNGVDVTRGWADTEPNNEFNNENCLQHIYGADTTKGLNDIPCDMNFDFMCEIITK